MSEVCWNQNLISSFVIIYDNISDYFQFVQILKLFAFYVCIDLRFCALEPSENLSDYWIFRLKFIDIFILETVDKSPTLLINLILDFISLVPCFLQHTLYTDFRLF